MSGVWRTMQTLFASSRRQVWIFLAGVPLVIGGSVPWHLGVCACGHRVSPSFALSGMLLSAAGAGLMLQTMLNGTLLLRQIASRRSWSLAPHARVRLLLSFLAGPPLLTLLAGVLVTLPVLALVLPHGHVPAEWWASVRDAAAALWALTTLLMLAMFVAHRHLSNPTAAIVLLLASIIQLLRIASIGRALGSLSIPYIVTLLAVTTLALVVFAIWFLRVRRIRPPAIAGRSAGRRGGFMPLQSPSASRRVAIRVMLLGDSSALRASRATLTLFAVQNAMMLCVFGPALEHDQGSVSHLALAPILTLLFLPILGYQLAGTIAQGSRRLWIGSGESRPRLFRTAERLAWRSLVLVATPILLVCLAEWFIIPHAGLVTTLPFGTSFAWPLFWVASALSGCGIYSGLLNFDGRNRANGWFFMAYFVLTALVYAYQFVHHGAPGANFMNWGVLFGLLAWLTVSRWIAVRRWHQVDWLNCSRSFSRPQIQSAH
jgi:hypothetical protein